MELNYYITLLKRWIWLLALGLILGVLAGLIVSRFQTPLYRSTTKVLIMQAPEDRVFDLIAANDQQLAQTFIELLVTQPIIQGTSERLGYPISTNQVSVERVGTAEVIQVKVEASDPQQAADIANTLVKVFIEQNANLQSGRYAASEENMQAQIQQVEKQITDLQYQLTILSTESYDTQTQEVAKTISDLQAEIRALQQEIVILEYPKELVTANDLLGRVIQVTPTPSMEDLRDLTVKKDRLAELTALRGMYQNIYVNLSQAKGGSGSRSSANAEQIQAAVVLYQQIYSNLLSNYEAIRLAKLKSTPNIVQVEEAQPSTRPIHPRPLNNMILGSILGLFVAIGIVFVIDHQDETFRTPAEVTEVLKLPILGQIVEIERPRIKGVTDNQVFVISNPRAPVAEAFRSLRTNLEFVDLEKPLQILLISSPGVSEGKTTVAVNLALMIAQTGKRVALVDADLRRPQIHQVLNIPNRLGLSDILCNGAQFPSVIQTLDHIKLSVITSGSLPPNPVEVLSSAKMSQVLSDLKAQFDTIIMDGPPFILADASVLSSRVDGVLLVIRLKKTPATTALSMLEQLERAGARVVGVTINRIGKNDSDYLYHGLKKYRVYSNENIENSDGAKNLLEK